MTAANIDLSPWRTVYEGEGRVEFHSSKGEVRLAPGIPSSPAETHSALVLHRETEKKPLRDFKFTATVQMNRQLRENSPNPWEVFWLFFNYRPGKDGQKETNYFILKTNGIEVGKASESERQEFLYTAPEPALNPITKPYKLTLIKKGQSLSVQIDEKPAFEIPGGSAEQRNLYDVPGAIGLYAEDADVLVHSVRIQSLD